MKKTVFTAIIMLALAVIFASCGWEVEIKNPEDNNLSTEENNLSTDDESLSTDEEDLSTMEDWSPEAAEIREELNLITKEFCNAFYILRDKGFELSAEKVRTINDLWFTYDLRIKNENGKEAVIPVKGIYMSNGDVAEGGFSVIDEKTIAFYAFEYAAFIDRETLAVTEITPDLSDMGEEVWINGVMKTKEGFAILATPMGAIGYGPDEEYETSFLTYDENGKLLKKIPVTHMAVKLNRYYTMPYFTRDMSILETEKGRILLAYPIGENLDKGVVCDCYEVANFGDEKRNVIIYSYSEGDGELGNYIAALYENGKAVSSIEMNSGQFYLNGESYSGTISPEKVAVLEDDFYGMTIELDFNKKSWELSYKIEEKHLYEMIDKSSDGNYSLWMANYTFGGDANSYNIVLKDNETGKIHLLGKGGGMYGGSTETGFLKNGDIYLTSHTTLEIFDPETAELIFTAAENFPLGKLEDGTERYLLTFRRDPVDFSYIVVYFETDENGIEWDYNEIAHADGKFHCELGQSYKIGFLDSEGNLKESYDTGCGVWYDGFGIQGVSMRYSEKELTITVSYTKGNEGFTGKFDMETKKFSYQY